MCVGGGGATPVLEKLSSKRINELAEPEAFVDSVRLKSPELKDNFLVRGFDAFLCASINTLLTQSEFPRLVVKDNLETHKEILTVRNGS